MKHLVFSIFDVKAGAFFPPFIMPAQGMALRAFSDGVADPNHNFGKHPEDYSLFKLGSFDDSQGTFELLPAPEVVATGISVASKLVKE